MRVFLTGATGFVGSAIIPELLEHGHQVLGLARSDASAAALTAAGAAVHRGSLDDLESLRAGAAAADGVIHCAFIHDFSNFEASCKADRDAINALGEVLAGSGRPLITTSGIGLLAQGGKKTENDAAHPGSAAGPRVPSEAATLAFVERGVRAMLMRLPPSVHGDGDHGFVPMLIGVARAKGVAAYVGEGANCWPAVHRLDTARLYRLAVENGTAGMRLHAVGDEGVPTREIAEVIGRKLDLPVKSIAKEEAAAHFGWMGHFFAMDVPASSALTQEWLAWKPVQPGLIADMEQGTYFAA